MDGTNRDLASAEVLLDIYRRMIRIERNDHLIRQSIMTGRLAIPYYSARGQEVIPSAVAVSMEDGDTICTIYRGIHDMVARGMPLRPLWAEIAGRVTGTCKGKGGPMHLTHPESGIMLTTGVVGSSMPIATGLAWAAKLDGKGRVAIAYFGDGASNIGAFHESLNFAAVQKLPVVFICQNNRFGEHTRYEHATAVDRIAKRAVGYDIPGFTVDGNDPDEMFAVARDAIARARGGDGPTLIEAITFRFMGHVFGDQDKYMTKEEKAAAIARDPLPELKARLIREAIASEDELAAIKAAVVAEVEDARDFALASDTPDPIELKRDVFAEELGA